MKSFFSELARFEDALAAIRQDGGRASDAARIPPLIARLNDNFRAMLAERALRPWKKGAGFAVSRLLSYWTDAVIRTVWTVFGLEGSAAVVATGGYGRRELSPHSDVDLLLLYDGRPSTAQVLAAVPGFLWDAGLKASWSVRTAAMVRSDAAADLSFLTSLFESRLVTGSRVLYEKLRQTLEKLRRRGAKSYLRFILADLERIVRDEPAELLLKEPNVKSSSGGLRTVQAAEWLCFFFTGRSGLRGLGEILPASSYRPLVTSYDRLLHIRNALHFVAGRKEDTLYISNLLKLPGMAAESEDLTEENFRLDEERIRTFMKQYYAWTERNFLALLETAELLSTGSDDAGAAPPAARDNPAAAVEYAVSVDERGRLPGFRSIRFAAESAHFVDAARPLSGETGKAFVRLLSSNDSYAGLTVLKLSGLLYAMVPPLQLVRHHAIPNPFHAYTVDQHALEAVRELEGLLTREQELPVLRTAKAVALESRDNLWVLKLALLLHDCGKAYEGDHARNSTELARSFLDGFVDGTIVKGLILFLIENHLVLSRLVRRLHPDDPAVARDLSRFVYATPFPRTYLDFLFLFTIADIRATNASNFTGYLGELLGGVYRRSSELIEGDGKGEERRRRELDDKRRRLSEANGGIEVFLDAMGDAYVDAESDDEILHDWAALRDVRGDWRLSVRPGDDSLELKIFAPDSHGLFSRLSGILTLCGADIVRARIGTLDGMAVDRFEITSVHGRGIGLLREENVLTAWVDEFEGALNRYLKDPDALESRLKEYRRKIHASAGVFHRKTSVLVAPLEAGKDGLFRIDVSGTDRPGFLHDVTRALSSGGLEIRSAAVDTSGWYVRDSFVASFGEKERGAPAESDRRFAALASEIEEVLE